MRYTLLFGCHPSAFSTARSSLDGEMGTNKVKLIILNSVTRQLQFEDVFGILKKVDDMRSIAEIQIMYEISIEMEN